MTFTSHIYVWEIVSLATGLSSRAHAFLQFLLQRCSRGSVCVCVRGSGQLKTPMRLLCLHSCTLGVVRLSLVQTNYFS